MIVSAHGPVPPLPVFIPIVQKPFSWYSVNMNYTSFFIPTLREVPADALIASHRLMFRAGMIRKLANGLFAYLPLGLRSFRKIEQIVREEMDAIGALELKPTVVVPGELWKESGRWDSMRIDAAPEKPAGQ